MITKTEALIVRGILSVVFVILVICAIGLGVAMWRLLS